MTIENVPDDHKTLRVLRQLSHELFGADYRAEIGLAVAANPEICKVDLKRAFVRNFDDPPSDTSVNGEFDRLVDMGFLEPKDSNGRSGKKYFVPKDSAYWDLCRELGKRASSS